MSVLYMEEYVFR